MLERAWLTAFRFDWSGDEEFALAFSCATSRAAAAIGLANRDLRKGAAADFIMIDAINVGDALARRPRQRRVVRRGKLVADDGVLMFRHEAAGIRQLALKRGEPAWRARLTDPIALTSA